MNVCIFVTVFVHFVFAHCSMLLARYFVEAHDVDIPGDNNILVHAILVYCSV